MLRLCRACILAAALSVLAFAGCGNTYKSEDPAYTVKETPVFRKELTDEKVQLRFYEDQPNVPYMGIAAYYGMMLPGSKMKVEYQRGGSFLLTSKLGSAVADLKKETLTSDNIADFTNLMTQVQKDMPNVYLDGAPYVRFEEASYEPETSPVTFAFADYGIDLRGDGKDVYFPLATLSDMFADLSYHYSSYNGVNIYVNADKDMPTAPERDEHYYEGILQMQRPADLAEFSYRETCFAIDHFYGYTGLGFLEREENLQNVGLDGALEDLGEAGTLTKKLLKSEDMAEYLVGRQHLQNLVSDGENTLLWITPPEGSQYAEILEKYSNMQDLTKDGMKYYEPFTELGNLWERETNENAQAMAERRNALYGEGATYYTEGDTAVCILNSFSDVDYEGWRAYFAGEGGLPLNDSFGVVVDAMNKANADPNICKFVLDISSNAGGSNDVLMGILGLWLGESEVTCDNVREGQTRTVRYEVDRNLDGRMDEADKAVKYNLQFADLTSGSTFACANNCASILEDHGILVLGHRTAGGSCAVVKYATPEGFLVQMSSDLCRFVNEEGEAPEGVEPNIELSPIAEDGSVDSTEMYDYTRISELMDVWYEE